jgi:uncharacterized protein (TIGR02453 family)
MPAVKAAFAKKTFQFFRDLARNNQKVWMDENRERYTQCVVQPFRQFLEDLAPDLLRLDGDFDMRGKTGANFSRINRDIRFAKDKTLYKAQMYLKVQRPSPGARETGQLYVGLSATNVTAGFRIYSGGKRKESVLALIACPRVAARPKWVAQQKKRLSRKYESYWYSTVKGVWTKHQGWPATAEDWKKIQAWIVRRKMKPAAATGAAFRGEILRTFRELYPLLKFTCIPE